jgi:predicted branched-subunit amino acid permease
MASPRSEFLAGVRAELPLLVGVIPFGMIYGVLARNAGLPAGLSQAMSAVIFAGSAQFVTIQLAASGTPLLPIVITAIVVNLRHALYSASVAPYIQHLPRRWKLLLAYLLTDEAYAVTITRYLDDDGRPPTPKLRPQLRPQLRWGWGWGADRRVDTSEIQADPQPATSNLQPSNLLSQSSNLHYFFLGSGLALWSSWQASTAAGIFLGTQIPTSWSLDFTLALTFIALVVPALKDRAGIVAALAGGITAILAVDLPLRLGLVFAALVGILAGLWSETAVKRAPEVEREKL